LLKNLVQLPNKLISYFFINLIRFYKYFISPLLGRNCIYHPSCSEYASIAIKQSGFIKAFPKILFRLLRCNAFFKGGYDPYLKN